MQQAKLIERKIKAGFEGELNAFLEQIAEYKILDIKFSTSLDGDKVSYSALIIYEV